MKVKDLFTVEVSGDVYENIAQCIAVYYETDIQLTDNGRKHFKQALDVPVKAIKKDFIIIDTEKYAQENGINLDNYSFEDGDVPSFVQNLIDLFWSIAGYCSIMDSNTWFEETNE